MSGWSGEETIKEFADAMPVKKWVRVKVGGVLYDVLNQGHYPWPDDLKDAAQDSGAQKRTEDE